MEVEITFFGKIILVLLGVFGSFAAGLITWYLKKNEECKKRLENTLDKIELRTLRQSSALLDLGTHLDEFKEKTHPDETKPHFFKKIDRKLRDEKGNL